MSIDVYSYFHVFFSSWSAAFPFAPINAFALALAVAINAFASVSCDSVCCTKRKPKHDSINSSQLEGRRAYLSTSCCSLRDREASRIPGLTF